MNRARRLLSVILVIVMSIGTLSFPAVVPKVFAVNTDAIEQEISSTYKAIRKKRGSSYSGWCGQFVADQLNYMKIGYVSNGNGLNGNQWYGNLISNAVTKYGYKQVKYGGNNCLNDIVSAKGKEVYNVVISFKHQYGKTDSNPGAGHVVLLHAIVDGYVYFCESYGNKKASEGQPQKRTISAFLSAYKSSYGSVLGAIHFSKDSDPTEVSFNVGSFSLNLSDNKTASLTATINGPYEHWLCEWDGTVIGIDKSQSGNQINIIVTARSAGSSILRLIAQDASENELARAEITVGVEQTISTLDVNCLLDGYVSVYGCAGYATFDMYINDSLVADDVTDWCATYPAGTSYEIKDIQTQNGCVFDGTVDRTYNGYYSAGLAGTFGTQPGFDVFLSFSGLTPTLVWTTYLDGHTYGFYSGRRTWAGAKEYAESLGGHLMTVTSEPEQNLILQFYSQHPEDKMWLGATNEETDEVWKWVTGETFGYDNWASEEPNNSGGTEHYLGTTAGNYWNDFCVDAADITGFIVEYEPSEIASTGLNGSYYELYQINTSWHSAEAFAEAKGGHLITATSEEEICVLKDFYAEISGSVWIGATDELVEEAWQWITGEPFDNNFAKWSTGEPNNANGNENYVLDTNGTWNDVPDIYEGAKGFVVEYEPPCFSNGMYHHIWDDGVSANDDNTVKVYTCTQCGAQKEEYIVTYDLRGGTGGILPQVKEQNVDLTLRPDVPEKAGYTFAGWTSDLSAIDVEFKSGDTYSSDAPVTLYAVYLLDNSTEFWGDVDCDGEVDPSDAKYILKYVVGKSIPSPEQSILGDVDLSGDLTEADAQTVLKYYVGKIDEFPAESLAEFSFIAPLKTNYYVNEELDSTGISIIVTNKNNDAVFYTLTDSIELSGYDASQIGTQTITATWRNKVFTFEITVSENVAGDINGDGRVNNKDLTRLMKYLAGENVVVTEAVLDVNGDGKVNNKDLTRLMKYLAGENVDIH